MSYRYDAFLSYRRADDWPRFVDGIFLPMLRRELSDTLGRQAEIFHDGRLEAGGAWPQELAVAVARSRVMICLWSRQYFGSDWCKAELGQMLARRQAVGGVPLPPLIVAAVIHDGKQLPRELDSIQRLEIQRYASPDLAERSQRWEELSFQVRDLAEHAGHAIEKAPPLDETWQGLAITAFEGLFTARQGQYAVPSLGGRS